MSENNLICFNIPEKSKYNILHANTSDDLRDTTGQFQIKVDGKDITKGEVTFDSGERHNLTVGDNRIIEFACELLDKLPEILDKKAAEPTIIEHGEDPWEFHFKRKEDDINCSVFWQCDKVFLHKDQRIPVEKYVSGLLEASKELGDLMLQNDLCKTFEVYNDDFEPAKRAAIRTVIKKEILNQGDLGKIFSKEYVDRVLYEKKRGLNDNNRKNINVAGLNF